jgi:hypothetical protein
MKRFTSPHLTPLGHTRNHMAFLEWFRFTYDAKEGRLEYQHKGSGWFFYHRNFAIFMKTSKGAFLCIQNSSKSPNISRSDFYSRIDGMVFSVSTDESGYGRTKSYTAIDYLSLHSVRSIEDRLDQLKPRFDYILSNLRNPSFADTVMLTAILNYRPESPTPNWDQPTWPPHA